MVKPQFEVGKGQVGAGGVVHNPSCAASAVLAVARPRRRAGLAHPSGSPPARYRAHRATSSTSCGCAPKPIGGLAADELERAVHEAVEAGPQ